MRSRILIEVLYPNGYAISLCPLSSSSNTDGDAQHDDEEGTAATNLTKSPNVPCTEVDEAEWSKLYSTVSLLFDVPKSGKIAAKVINHYGNEVLKVYRVG